MIYYCYLVRCSDDSLYCGIAQDLEKRMKEHNSGTARAAKYTRARGPVTLVYSEQLPNRGAALRREAEIKRWPKTKKESFLEAQGVSSLSVFHPV